MKFSKLKPVFQSAFGLDLRSLAFGRIALALVILYDLCDRVADLSAHYSDLGLYPVELAKKVNTVWMLSIHSIDGSYGYQLSIFMIAFISAFMLLVGYKTKWVTPICWFLLMSVQNRNPIICYGADSVLRMAIFWGMFLPWGKRYAIDALSVAKSEIPKKVAHIGSMAYILQIFFIYFFTAILKDGDPWRTDFTAVYYAMSLDELKTDFTDLLYPHYELMKGLTIATLIYELLGAFLIFMPNWRIRLFGIIGFVLMQIGFWLFLRLGIFPITNICVLIALIPGECWDLIHNKAKRTKKVLLYYDDDCGFCKKMIRMFSRSCFVRNIDSKAAQTDQQLLTLMNKENSWIVSIDNKQYLRFDAVIAVLKQSYILFPIASILNFAPFRKLGNLIYTTIAKHRHGYCKVPKKPLWTFNQVQYNTLTTVVVSFALSFTATVNIISVNKNIKLPEALDNFSKSVSIKQNWAMFAPYPYKGDGWYVSVAELENGTYYDIMNNQEVNWEKPPKISAQYKTARWGKFIRNVRKKKFKAILPFYSAFLGREWNRNHPKELHVKKFNLFFIMEKTGEDYEVTLMDKRRLIQQHYSN